MPLGMETAKRKWDNQKPVKRAKEYSTQQTGPEGPV